VKIDIDASELLRFTRRLNDLPDAINRAVIDALNETGDAASLRVASEISRETGFGLADAQRFVEVDRAHRGKPEYDITVHAGMIEDERLNRQLPSEPWAGSDRDKIYGQALLVKVITSEDKFVCEICQRIAEEGPYTPEELEALKLQHPHFLNPQLHCRCAIQPFEPRSRLSTRTGQGRVSVGREETLRQLAQRIKDEVHTTIRAKLR
jgi:hypothetical protein